MNGRALHDATLPVLRHYVGRAEAMIDKADAATLASRLAPDALCCGAHLRTALGFVGRTLEPLTGRRGPDTGSADIADARALAAVARAVARYLEGIGPDDFGSAGPVRHVAGEAHLVQSAREFALLYGLPNFLFHLATAHALMRLRGLPVGKADFDGFHHYDTHAGGL